MKSGSVLTLGSIDGPGQRAYLAVKGGFDVPEYLGSRSTFTLGQFGGHVGRALRKGDVLRLTHSTSTLDGCARLSRGRDPDIRQTLGYRRDLRASRRARLFHRRTTSALFSPPTGKCITTRAVPAFGSSVRSRSGLAPTAGRRGCIPPTSTTTPTPSARSTTPAICRSFSARTGPAWGASCVRLSSLAPTSGKWGSCDRAIRSGSAGFRRTTRRCCSGSRVRGGCLFRTATPARTTSSWSMARRFSISSCAFVSTRSWSG